MYANFSFPGKKCLFFPRKKGGGRRNFFPFILAHTWERRERIGGNIWESVGNHARLINWQNFKKVFFLSCDFVLSSFFFREKKRGHCCKLDSNNCPRPPSRLCSWVPWGQPKRREEKKGEKTEKFVGHYLTQNL